MKPATAQKPNFTVAISADTKPRQYVAVATSSTELTLHYDDARQLVKEANAYPRLIEALKQWEAQSEAFDTRTQKGAFALAAVVNDLGDAARALLRELGEQS